jgi:hypothetical protein
MEAENVAVCEAAKEAVWLRKFLADLGVMRIEQSLIMLFYDSSCTIQGTMREGNTSSATIISLKR